MAHGYILPVIFRYVSEWGTLAEKSKIMNIKKNPLFVSEFNEVFFGVTLVVSRR